MNYDMVNQIDDFFADTICTILTWGIKNPKSANTLSSIWCSEMLKTDGDVLDLDEINEESLKEIEMLLYDLNLDIEKEENNERGLKLNLIPRPFYKKFSRNLWLMIKMERPSFTWHKNGIKLNLLSLDKNCLKRLELIENKIGEFKKNWYSTFENESTFQKYSDKDDLSLNTLKEFILEFITPADIGLMLGLFETEGSLFRNIDSDKHLVLLPSMAQCIHAFSAYHKTKDKSCHKKGARPTQLTTGARALTKHWHRDRTTYFWPQCYGTERQKNNQANATLIKLIKDTAWMNLHLLPGGKPAFEIRNIQGYGARWELKLKLDHDVDILVVDHIIFRGLLEPPMEDGHTNNWLH